MPDWHTVHKSQDSGNMNVEEDLDSAGCTHIRDLLLDTSMRDPFIQKFKSMIEWSLHRTFILKNSTKRRKVWIHSSSSAKTLKHKVMYFRLPHHHVGSVALHCPVQLLVSNALSRDVGLASTSSVTWNVKITHFVGFL